jgi:membrane protein implicated in regulation of membrane protease activity
VNRRFPRYVLWQLPGWAVAAATVIALAGMLELPAWTAAVALAAYVLKDLLLYPAMRAVFRPPAAPDLVGARGEAVEPIAPIGYVRVAGELWRATTPDRRPLPAGAAVRVVGSRGLTLVVQADPSA